MLEWIDKYPQNFQFLLIMKQIFGNKKTPTQTKKTLKAKQYPWFSLERNNSYFFTKVQCLLRNLLLG